MPLRTIWEFPAQCYRCNKKVTLRVQVLEDHRLNIECSNCGQLATEMVMLQLMRSPEGALGDSGKRKKRGAGKADPPKGRSRPD